jgi:hypothetical protein
MADTLAQRASSRRGTSNDGVTSGGGVLRRDAHLWGVPTRVAVAVALTPVVVAVAMFLLADAQQTFFWLSDEDHPIEWLQFALLVPAIVAFAATALKLSRLRYNAAATVTAGLTLGLFFIAGEEISWGQRILGFGTPSSLQGTNYQDEATLHNIGGLHQYFVHGVALIGFYGAVAPLLWYAVRSRRARTPLSLLLVPPLFLAPAFAIAFLYRGVRFLFAPEDRYPSHIGQIVEYSETTELCLYFGVLIFAVLYLRVVNRTLGRDSRSIA